MKNKATDRDSLMARLVAGKSASRRRRARMPFKRKVEIVVHLQEISAAISRTAGRRPARSAWRFPAEKH